MTYLEDSEDAKWKARWIEKFIHTHVPDKPTIQICDIGCGNGMVLKHLRDMMDRPAVYFGFDISDDAIIIAQEYNDSTMRFECTDYIKSPHSPDVALLIDVVEHVGDVHAFIRTVHETSKYTIFHIPLENHVLSMLYPPFQQGQHDKVGHVHYFTKETALQLLKDCGCEIISWEYTDAYNLRRVYGWKDRILNPIRKYMFDASPELASKIVGGSSLMVICR